MARLGRGLCALAVILILLAAPAGAGGATPPREADVLAGSGSAWAHATLDVADAECLVFVLAGRVRHAGDGQAALLDVPGVGHVGMYFHGSDAVAVHASVDVSVVNVRVSEHVGTGTSHSRYEAVFEACSPPDGRAYADRLDAWALRTDGVSDSTARIRASTGSVRADAVASGASVRLWGLDSFDDGAAVAAGAEPAGHRLAPGLSASAHVTKTAQLAGGAFGALVHFDLVEDYELQGPPGYQGWHGLTGSGGSIDLGAFHGPPGEWTARMRVSAGLGASPRAFFVVADLAG